MRFPIKLCQVDVKIVAMKFDVLFVLPSVPDNPLAWISERSVDSQRRVAVSMELFALTAEATGIGNTMSFCQRHLATLWSTSRTSTPTKSLRPMRVASLSTLSLMAKSAQVVAVNTQSSEEIIWASLLRGGEPIVDISKSLFARCKRVGGFFIFRFPERVVFFSSR